VLPSIHDDDDDNDTIDYDTQLKNMPSAKLVWLGSLVVSVSDSITARSWVRSLTTALSSNNLGQVVHKPQPVGAMPQFGGPAD